MPSPEKPPCVLCTKPIYAGKPHETSIGLMCPDSTGCRRRAYDLLHPPLRNREGDQPLPVINDEKSIQDRVIEDILARKELGIKRYGTALQPFNGRDPLQDLYDELIDATQYVKQELVERDEKGGSNATEESSAR